MDGSYRDSQFLLQTRYGYPSRGLLTQDIDCQQELEILGIQTASIRWKNA